MKPRKVVLTVAAALLAAALPAGALVLKDKVFDTKSVGTVVFSHQKHLGHKKIGNNCKACHNASLEKNRRYTMNDMEKGKSCGACHDGKKAFALADCTRCHPVKDVMMAVKETGPVAFRHSRHIEKEPCGSCHTKLFKTKGNPHASMAAMEKGKSCGACHDGKKAFPVKECAKCHPVQEIRFAVASTGPTTFSHAMHTEAFSCKECHPRLWKPAKGNKPATMADMGKKKSCGGCHDGKGAFGLKECAKCHPTKDIPYEGGGAGKVSFSHKFHTDAYGCQECHPRLWKPAKGNKPATMNEMEKGKSCGACHDGKGAFSVSDCDKCHKQ